MRGQWPRIDCESGGGARKSSEPISCIQKILFSEKVGGAIALPAPNCAALDGIWPLDHLQKNRKI